MSIYWSADKYKTQGAVSVMCRIADDHQTPIIIMHIKYKIMYQKSLHTRAHYSYSI